MEEFEEFEYQPKSVKELFIEMKNIVELMVDLAYTSILFGDKEIAEEVLDLEERMDLLNYHLMTHAVLAARNPKEAEQALQNLRKRWDQLYLKIVTRWGTKAYALLAFLRHPKLI